MTAPLTKPAEISEGQLWTFVHPEGRQVAYVIDWSEDSDFGPAAVAKIRNIETGGIGWVTHHWLRREPDDPSDRRGRFVFDGYGQQAQAA